MDSEIADDRPDDDPQCHGRGDDRTDVRGPQKNVSHGRPHPQGIPPHDGQKQSAHEQRVIPVARSEHDPNVRADYGTNWL